ncbi:riboflavin synthase subunit alpha [Dermacoccus nishinomiyaensis]|uniref:Riboflavin synthase n=1 Tax=Dermacoccus nishinomiyaensis TaxID=1274 RepID=A0A075JFB8_9MICO|nr:riboflavin synthase [Dermacoccus nishinomiyaensis]AIF40936.1 riboflavin synthase subunit alpha [Dermacoccus nishinomiyaensis]
MFTGIIEATGTLERIEHTADAAILTIAGAAVLDDAHYGDSIAVNGVCLTVTTFDEQRFSVDVMKETLDRTSLGALVPGSRVNLERAMSAQARFGGHVVQGHVDATVRITAIEPGERWSVVRFDLPVDLAPYVVEKGSVTLDGVSLTVASRQEASFSVSLIPTTLELTTFGAARVGDLVNVEVDVLAKYVEQMLAPRLAALDIRLVELDARLAASEGRA